MALLVPARIIEFFFLFQKAGEVGVCCGGAVVLGRAQVEDGGLRGATMRSEKTEKVLQTLKKWRDDGLITEQEYEDDKRGVLK